VKDEQRTAGKTSNIFTPALQAGGKVIDDKNKIRHIDGDFFLHEGVCDTARKVTLAGADAPPEQAAHIPGVSPFPALHIVALPDCLRVLAVVVLKSQVPH